MGGFKTGGFEAECADSCRQKGSKDVPAPKLWPLDLVTQSVGYVCKDGLGLENEQCVAFIEHRKN